MKAEHAALIRKYVNTKARVRWAKLGLGEIVIKGVNSDLSFDVNFVVDGQSNITLGVIRSEQKLKEMMEAAK